MPGRPAESSESPGGVFWYGGGGEWLALLLLSVLGLFALRRRTDGGLGRVEPWAAENMLNGGGSKA